ncbi:MAG: diguanylate cyclase [Hormoscilla sp. SP5CHS1]|nr:diguanylate cyclase [Hormoscilla sp. SP12CHS1]MBC6455948.1 diguanylate cyclase [Hormoscilla sp. SP5CHS1]
MCGRILKFYNDTHGHFAGDACLQLVAGALQTRCSGGGYWGAGS